MPTLMRPYTIHNADYTIHNIHTAFKHLHIDRYMYTYTVHIIQTMNTALAKKPGRAIHCP